VHLANTNIRDVVHRRLLHKTREAEALLRDLFLKHRADLKLFAYGCDDTTPDDFAEVYPLLPGHVDLIMQITSALRTRSARSQGDDQAIRGLLQLLGELFRSQRLAEQPVGALITLDQVYEVQHTALDSETQNSMARILAECAGDESGLQVRVAKVVALLEQIQESLPTTAELVAKCLYDRLDRGSQVTAITEALEGLRRRNLLSYSEKQGYKIQSTAGEEWERERREIGVGSDAIIEMVRAALAHLVGDTERPRLLARSFPWKALFSDGDRQSDASLVDAREDAKILVDFRFVAEKDRTESTWVKRSAESTFQERLIWVCAARESVRDAARELGRSRGMVKRFQPRRESLLPARRHLLDGESDRAEELDRRLREAVADAYMAGQLYFRGNSLGPTTLGASFTNALCAAGTRILAALYPHYTTTNLTPSEIGQLLDRELSGVSPKLVTELRILQLDNGRYVPTCAGLVPTQVWEKIDQDDGLSGASLLAHFGGPPYGYHPSIVRASVAGLLRAGRIKLQAQDGKQLTSPRDAGTKDLFDADRAFRSAQIFKAGEDGVSPQVRAKIAKLFDRLLGEKIERDDNAIADVVASRFPDVVVRARTVQTSLLKLDPRRSPPPELTRLEVALEDCLRVVRQTRSTVQQVRRHYDDLSDGLRLLKTLEGELTDAAIAAVADATGIAEHQGAQLRAVGAISEGIEAALGRVEAHLAGDRPWQAITGLQGDVDAIRRAYEEERQRRLDRQQTLIEEARARIRRRDGFATLSGEKSARVLGGFQRVATETDAQAIAPDLAALDAPFMVALRQAEDEAGLKLDELLSQGDRPVIRRVQLAEGLVDREVKSEADVEAVVGQIRERLLEQVRAGVRVRLV
ncbi:MAG TPA: BREX system P-loop protein BrxC, partial [Nannocystaceae bacterium]|nr:BREX system P-loop protein BrxC [Nannocystaceae bacterium]